MKKALIILIVIFWGSIAHADIVASRTSGVAPLYVHFYADDMVIASDGNATEPFHDYEGYWLFDDSGAGDWVDGKSKNVAYGGVTAHVFDSSGTYTVSCTVRNSSGTVSTDTETITVSDPDTYYSTTATTCVNPSGDSTFTGCPSGANQVQTDDLTTITGYCDAGERLLLKRGASWTSAGVDFPDNTGPVTIGAYGTCTSPDSLGICSNAPQITMSGTPVNASGEFINLTDKLDWRIMDLYITGSNSFRFVWGSMDFGNTLIYKNEFNTFYTGVSWSHWKDDASDIIEYNGIFCNDGSNTQYWVSYSGSEHFAVMGNVFDDSTDSHTLRVWQSYIGVIAHNRISGAGTTNVTGRHVLKLFGPNESEVALETGLALDHRTKFTVVSDNVFGHSGAQAIAIGPQNAASDERLTDIVFERNLYQADFGTVGTADDPQIALEVWGRYFTVRNNIFDASNETDNFFTWINLQQRGVEPTPLAHRVYNNTIYRDDSSTGALLGIFIESTADDLIVRNNLFSFPNATGSITIIDDNGTNTTSSNNSRVDSPGYVDPDNATPLSRDFSISPPSASVIDQGYTINEVLDDYSGLRRLGLTYDIGAHEHGAPAESGNVSSSNMIGTITTSGNIIE